MVNFSMYEDTKILVLYTKNLTMDWKTIKAFGMCITQLKKLALATLGVGLLLSGARYFQDILEAAKF